MQKEIEAIRNLVAGADLEKALKRALKFSETLPDKDFKNSCLLWTGQYKRGKRDAMILGDDDGFNQTRRKLSHYLLTSLDDLSEDVGTTAVVEAPSQELVATPEPEDIVIVPKSGDDITQILFLASNPSDTGKLQLTTEHSRVSSRLQEAPQPEKFPLNFRQAVTPSEFGEFLFMIKPDIVHFSGHGDRSAPEVLEMVGTRAGRKAKEETKIDKEESGIFLLDEDKRNSHFVSSTYLKHTFKVMVKRRKIPINVVVFNACHSGEQAKAVSEVVPYVIGTSWTVRDDAAIAFATGFYFGIAQNMSVEDAFDQGVINALAYNEPEDKFLLYINGQKAEW